MGNIARLVAPITYYVGCCAAILGALSHFVLTIGVRLDAMSLTKRNLFEASILLFMISMASVLQRRGQESNQNVSSIASSRIAKKQAA